MEVAASNTSSRLHCSSWGFSVGSSGSGPGSGPGGGLGFGAAVGTGVRLPERWISKIQSGCAIDNIYIYIYICI